MYQSNIKNSTEENFSEFFKEWQVNVCSLELEKDDKEWDMHAFYAPKATRIWNHPRNLDNPCRILEKNHSIALVQFVLPLGDIPGDMYLLSDLEKRV